MAGFRILGLGGLGLQGTGLQRVQGLGAFQRESRVPLRGSINPKTLNPKRAL